MADDPTTESPDDAEPLTDEAAKEDDMLSSTLIRKINALTPGLLTVHFARRDVSFEMYGDDAARILMVHRRGRADALTNELDPDSSWMLNQWMSLRLGDALAVSWAPGPDAAKAVVAALNIAGNDIDAE